MMMSTKSLLLLLLSAYVLAHSRVKISEVSSSETLEGHTRVIVEDVIDDGVEHCNVYVELVGSGAGKKSAYEDEDVLLLYPGENMDFHDPRTSPFKGGDFVKIIVDTDKNDESIKVIRSVVDVRPTAKSNDKATPSGLQNLLLVVVNYNDESPACDETCVQNNMFDANFNNVADMYAEGSYGSVSFVQNPVRVLNINENVGDNDEGAGLTTLANKYNALMGVNPTDYDLIDYHTPAINGIGVAYFPGRYSFCDTSAPDTIAHELGHNFGFPHSGSDFDDDLTVEDQYNDRTCCMGYQLNVMRNFNAMTRIDAGWISPSALALADPSVCETYTINALYNAPNPSVGPSTVIASRSGTSSANYYISFRSDDGYDGKMSSSYRNQVHVHSRLSAKGFVASLANGATYTASSSQFRVTVNSIGQSSAQVEICGHGDPVSPSPSPPPIISCGDSFTGSTVGLLNQYGNDAPDSVYFFSLTEETDVTFSSCNSAFDTYLRIFNTLGIQVAGCDDCGPCGYQTVLDATLDAGDYIFVVDGYSSSQGNYQIDFTCTTQDPSPSSTNTRTASSTSTASESSTNTRTASSTNTRTASSTNTRTASSTSTASESSTNTASESSTNTRTASSTNTRTASNTDTRTASSTNTRTASSTNTRTASVSPTPAPQTISCGESVQGSTVGQPNTLGNRAGEQFYSFELSERSSVVFDSCGSNFDTWLRVFNSAGNQVLSCDDCGPCGTRTVLSGVLSAGSYVFVVEGYSSREGTYTVSFGCSAQVECGDQIQGSTIAEPSNYGQPAGDKTYLFSLSTFTTVTFDSCASDYDTWLEIYTPGGALILSDDDSVSCGDKAIVSSKFEPGDYVVVVDGFDSSEGNFDVTITCDGVEKEEKRTPELPGGFLRLTELVVPVSDIDNSDAKTVSVSATAPSL